MGSLALKLDISKAYDRVEWGFLKGIMIRLGFPEVWVDRVMCCVTTTSYFVLINGKTYGHITPSRSLRQGDPHSPYLFLLCTEGFTLLLHKAEIEGRIQGVSICRRAPRITNILFADDSLIFCQAKQSEVQVISEILQGYADASGQCINLDKSSIYFSGNTPLEQKNWIKDYLRVKEVDRFETYLGLPMLVGRAKYHSFAYLKDRVWKKLQG
ncbi:putative mitochondrial protein AtMg01250 [Castanea sativa]|uniref:putative mitochondrial protein AtMg01250 n=1 Tax=Castanea sativa TaxID=21020 RepID=UPI003F64B555